MSIVFRQIAAVWMKTVQVYFFWWVITACISFMLRNMQALLFLTGHKTFQLSKLVNFSEFSNWIV